jgi:hypothetical protein
MTFTELELIILAIQDNSHYRLSKVAFGVVDYDTLVFVNVDHWDVESTKIKNLTNFSNTTMSVGFKNGKLVFKYGKVKDVIAIEETHLVGWNSYTLFYYSEGRVYMRNYTRCLLTFTDDESNKVIIDSYPCPGLTDLVVTNTRLYMFCGRQCTAVSYSTRIDDVVFQKDDFPHHDNFKELENGTILNGECIYDSTTDQFIDTDIAYYCGRFIMTKAGKIRRKESEHELIRMTDLVWALRRKSKEPVIFLLIDGIYYLMGVVNRRFIVNLVCGDKHYDFVTGDGEVWRRRKCDDKYYIPSKPTRPVKSARNV